MQSNPTQHTAILSSTEQCKAAQSNAKQQKAITKQHKVMQSNTTQCIATQSNLNQHEQCKTTQSNANHQNAMQTIITQCNATQSHAQQHKAMRSNTKQCKATQSNTDYHKAMRSNTKQYRLSQGNADQHKSMRNNTKATLRRHYGASKPSLRRYEDDNWERPQKKFFYIFGQRTSLGGSRNQPERVPRGTFRQSLIDEKNLQW